MARAIVRIVAKYPKNIKVDAPARQFAWPSPNDNPFIEINVAKTGATKPMATATTPKIMATIKFPFL